jgi:hypothetical protein
MKAEPTERCGLYCSYLLVRPVRVDWHCIATHTDNSIFCQTAGVVVGGPFSVWFFGLGMHCRPRLAALFTGDQKPMERSHGRYFRAHDLHVTTINYWRGGHPSTPNSVAGDGVRR